MQIKSTTAAAVPLGLSGDPKFAGAESPQDSVAKAQALQTKLQASLQQIANTDEFAQYLSMEDQAKLAQEKAMLQADIDLLDTFIETGQWDPAQQSVDIQAIQDQLITMEVGWNDMQGHLTPVEVSDGVFEVTLATSGVYDPLNPKASNALAFVVPEDAEKITGTTIGNDIQIVVEKSDGNQAIYLLKNMAVRPEAIYIYGAQKTSGLEVDFAQAIRVSNGQYGQPFGETNGFILWGGSSHDKLVGSGGADILVGSGGNDLIEGLLGSDQLYGDNFGVGAFGASDGNDVLHGGAGQDVIRGGGGSKDVATKGIGDAVAEAENVTDEALSAPNGNWYGAPNWKVETGKDGETVFTIQDGQAEGGVIDLTLPDGYTMAAGTMDAGGQALLITMVGFDPNGDPQTARIRINDFFDPDLNVTLNVHGNGAQNILDFHEVELNGNVLNLYGAGGDDVLLAAKSYLDTLGVDLTDLGKGTYSHKKLENLVGALRNAAAEGIMDWGGYKWQGFDNDDNAPFINANGEIELQFMSMEDHVPLLAFDRPPGFTDAIWMVDENHPEDLLVVLINRSADQVDQVVVRIKNGVHQVTGPLTMDGAPIAKVGAIPKVVGGEGGDTVVGSTASAALDGETVISGSYDFAYAPPADPDTTLTADKTAKEAELKKLQGAN